MGIYADRYKKYVGKYCEIVWVDVKEERHPGEKHPTKIKESRTSRGLVEEVYEPKFGRDYLDLHNDRGIYLDSIREIKEVDE
ncbi:MAG: hypothetical protein GC154_08830 [bacterium]|nr:hypothetical protein [bacterium]